MNKIEEQEILAYLAKLFNEIFELPVENVTPEARLYEDLDLDSIDAVDISVYLQKETGTKINTEEFHGIKTVADLIAVVARLQKEAKQS